MKEGSRKVGQAPLIRNHDALGNEQKAISSRMLEKVSSTQPKEQFMTVHRRVIHITCPIIHHVYYHRAVSRHLADARYTYDYEQKGKQVGHFPSWLLYHASVAFDGISLGHVYGQETNCVKRQQCLSRRDCSLRTWGVSPYAANSSCCVWPDKMQERCPFRNIEHSPQY
jgi:hypothetical protein